MSVSLAHPDYREDLGDGLILRWSTAADLPAIQDLYAYVFRESDDQPLNSRLPLWAADLASGRHFSSDANDFALVEDTINNRIAAVLVVLRQKWNYEEIEFEIGRPEIVGSRPEYRNKGLVRRIFDLFHARSAERGQLAQGITGIPYFYRQFGYEYALELEGQRRILFAGLPTLKEGEQEPYTLRPATLDDLDLIGDLYRHEARGFPGYEALVWTSFHPEWFRWALTDQNPESGQGANMYIFCTPAGEPLGYVMLSRFRWGETLPVFGLSAKPGVPLTAVMPSLLRQLATLAQTIQSWREPAPAATRLTLMLGEHHPVYEAINPNFISRTLPAYGWYVRVPDLPALIWKIAPVLEQRLLQSPIGAYSGELKFDFYRGGLRLVFEQGKLTVAEPWKRPTWKPGTSAGFPPLVFLQLLFGRRSLNDLMYAFPDVWAEEEIQAVLTTLFPKRRSWAIGLD
jgi:hypothetical protein